MSFRFVPMIAIMVFLLMMGVACGTSADSTRQSRTINVTGSADVMVAPDEVVFSVGVESNDIVLTKAKNDNDAVVKRVLAQAQSMGVEEKYIQTDYISIEPRYQDAYLRDGYQKRELIGYVVRKNIAFTLKDVSRFEKLYSTILESGVNHVYGIEFRTTELRKHRDQGRALAIQAAREKAEALAKEMGQTVGAPLSISENSSWGYRSYSWWGVSSAMSQNVVQNAPSQGTSDGSSTLALGQIAINASVSVTFELK
jgi:uncharacterized protein YggE